MSMEYTRKVQPVLGEAGGRPAEERTMSFATVTVAEGSGAEQKVSGQRGPAEGMVPGDPSCVPGCTRMKVLVTTRSECCPHQRITSSSSAHHTPHPLLPAR